MRGPEHFTDRVNESLDLAERAIQAGARDYRMGSALVSLGLGAASLGFRVHSRSPAFEGGEQQPPDTERDLNTADGGIAIALDKQRDPNGDPGHAKGDVRDAYSAWSHGCRTLPL
jgi:hypothetical protein